MHTLFVFLFKGFLHSLKNIVTNDTCCYNHIIEVSENVWEIDCGLKDNRTEIIEENTVVLLSMKRGEYSQIPHTVQLRQYSLSSGDTGARIWQSRLSVITPWTDTCPHSKIVSGTVLITHLQGMKHPHWVRCVNKVIKLHLNVKKVVSKWVENGEKSRKTSE